MRLVGTTKSTISAIRERTHWNAASLAPMDPVTLGLTSQLELDFEVNRANKEKPAVAAATGGTLLPASETTAKKEAEVAAIVIRECRSTGMTSRIAYAEPGGRARPAPGGSEVRRIGRNDPCPCGSGKKFKACCGRRTA